MREKIELTTLALLFISSVIVFTVSIKESVFKPSASDLADGKAWAEYTSDGQRHWVWKGK